MGRPHTPLRVAFRRPWPGTLRGFILWLFGWSFMIIGGLNYIGTTPPDITRLYLQYPFQVADPTFYGWVFVTAGLLAVLTSYCHFDRDRYGYTTLAVLSSLWATAYVAGWLFSDSPVRAVGGSVIWVLFAGILITCASIPKIPFSLGREDD